jgi:ADP-ribose pyrophosphatase YjhB (NUDIX family)
MRRWLLRLWLFLPGWLQQVAVTLIQPRFLVVVGAMIFNAEGQLLLCEHTYRRRYPWGLPGGHLNHGEDPQLGLGRELFEETGLLFSRCRLILVENSAELPLLCLTYLCEGLSGSFVPSDEVSRIQFFAPDQLPELSAEQGATIARSLVLLKTTAGIPNGLA